MPRRGYSAVSANRGHYPGLVHAPSASLSPHDTARSGRIRCIRRPGMRVRVTHLHGASLCPHGALRRGDSGVSANRGCTFGCVTSARRPFPPMTVSGREAWVHVPTGGPGTPVPYTPPNPLSPHRAPCGTGRGGTTPTTGGVCVTVDGCLAVASGAQGGPMCAAVPALVGVYWVCSWCACSCGLFPRVSCFVLARRYPGLCS